MTLLAQPQPKCVLQFRASTLPPRQLSIGAVIIDKDIRGMAVQPQKQIAVQIGTQTTPSMVEFAMPCGMARELFRSGLAMCDEIDGVAA